MFRGTAKIAFQASALIAVLFVSGCSVQEEAQRPEVVSMEPVPEESVAQDGVSEVTDEEEPIDTGSDSLDESDIEDALAEQEQFLKDQELPLDGSPLTAVTPEQKKFIEEQRTHVESQGGVWTPEAETLTLALTADACETAILNSHEVDTSTVRTHIATSPLFLTIPEEVTADEREQAEASMAEIMVYGMQHMCADDYPEWRDAVLELYPDRINTVP